MTGAALDPRVRGQLRSVAIAAGATLVVALAGGWFPTPVGSGVILIMMFGFVPLPALALIALGLIVIYACVRRSAPS